MNRDDTLWRFMDFTKYVAMLHRRALFFTRADQLPDPFEGVSARPNRLGNGAAIAPSDLRRRVLLSCWHQNEHESAAMWRIYLSNEEGVAIRTTATRLIDALSGTGEELHLGQVRYLDYEREPVPSRPALAPFFCKRKSFDYEREVRLLWRPAEVVDEPGRYLAADLEVLVERVIVSPTAEPWFAELVRSVTEKYGLELQVCTSAMLVGVAGTHSADDPDMATSTNQTNVLDLLKSQHQEVDDLFEKLESGKGDREAVFIELADKLAAHATIEEKIFYPSVMQSETSELLHESVEEHLAIKRTLADLLDLDPEDDEEEFDAKLSVLKEQVSHHAHEEEEGELFPILRKALSADQLAALGNECLAMFEELLQHEPRRQVPSETTEAAPLPS